MEHLVIGRFLGVFWFADKFGAAAATGHSVVCKQQYQYQATIGSTGNVGHSSTGELLWKRFVGPVSACSGGGGGGLVRVYAGKDLGSGAVTAIIINLSQVVVNVSLTITGRPFQDHHLYALSAWPDARTCKQMAPR